MVARKPASGTMQPLLHMMGSVMIAASFVMMLRYGSLEQFGIVPGNHDKLVAAPAGQTGRPGIHFRTFAVAQGQ